MAVQNQITVLVVDPDPQQRQLLSQVIQQRYRVVAVGSLTHAREAIVIHRPAIVLLELDEPDGDGMQLVRQLREDPTTRHVVVCCVTRRSGIRDKVSAFHAGADDFVVKPINVDSFLYRVVLLTRIRQVSPGGSDLWAS